MNRPIDATAGASNSNVPLIFIIQMATILSGSQLARFISADVMCYSWVFHVFSIDIAHRYSHTLQATSSFADQEAIALSHGRLYHGKKQNRLANAEKANALPTNRETNLPTNYATDQHDEEHKVACAQLKNTHYPGGTKNTADSRTKEIPFKKFSRVKNDF